MKGSVVAIALLTWSLILGAGSFAFGYSVRGLKQVSKEAQAVTKEAKVKSAKDRQALAVGVRTEQAQAATDTAFQRIRSDYEADQRKNPAAGCVLDPDSLRRWNEANAQSDGPAAGEPDGQVPAAAEAEAGRERGQ